MQIAELRLQATITFRRRTKEKIKPQLHSKNSHSDGKDEHRGSPDIHREHTGLGSYALGRFLTLSTFNSASYNATRAARNAASTLAGSETGTASGLLDTVSSEVLQKAGFRRLTQTRLKDRTGLKGSKQLA